MITVYRHPSRDPAATIARARAAAGMCACEPFRASFKACLPLPPVGASWPLNVPFRMWRDANGKLHTEGVSTCGLFAMFCWDVDSGKPYVNGTAFERIEQVGQSVDEPAGGDVILTGSHAIVVVDAVDAYGYLETIEGGQVCLDEGAEHEHRGLQAIHLRRDRRWPLVA